MARARAKLALLYKMEGTTKSMASSLVDDVSDASIVDPQTGKVNNIEKLKYGSIVRVPSFIDIMMPAMNMQAMDHTTVMQMVLRIVAARFSMPEYLLSSDASNGNYASILVSESPFVKSMERLQKQYERAYTSNRWDGCRQSMIWRQIAWAVECGHLPSSVFRLVDITATGPTLSIRDPAKDVQVDKAYHEMGVKSILTIQKEQGLDSDIEKANFAQERGSKRETPTNNAFVTF